MPGIANKGNKVNVCVIVFTGFVKMQTLHWKKILAKIYEK